MPVIAGGDSPWDSPPSIRRASRNSSSSPILPRHVPCSYAHSALRDATCAQDRCQSPQRRHHGDPRPPDAPLRPLPDSLEPPSRVIIERVQPEIDAGRYPVKRVQGDILQVSADIFKDGHDKIAAVVKYRRRMRRIWQEAEMRFVDNDRWAGESSCPTTPATSTPSKPSPTAVPPGATRSRRSSTPGKTSPSSCSKGAPSSPRRCPVPRGTTVRR